MDDKTPRLPGLDELFDDTQFLDSEPGGFDGANIDETIEYDDYSNGLDTVDEEPFEEDFGYTSLVSKDNKKPSVDDLDPPEDSDENSLSEDNPDSSTPSKNKPSKNKKTPFKAIKKPKLPPVATIVKTPLNWLLWAIDKVSILFYWLGRIPVIGKLFKPLHVGLKLTRIVAGLLVSLFFVILPILIFTTYGATQSTIEKTRPDDGHVTVSEYEASGNNLAITIVNDGKVIDDDIKPNITVKSKTILNPSSWFTPQVVAQCQASDYSAINPGETQTITLTCDNTISGFIKTYEGELSDVQ